MVGRRAIRSWLSGDTPIQGHDIARRGIWQARPEKLTVLLCLFGII